MSDEASAELLTPKKKKAFKDNSQVIRVFDSDGYRLRSDALCFKDENKREVNTHWKVDCTLFILPHYRYCW